MAQQKKEAADGYAPFAYYDEFAEWFSKFATYIVMRLCVRPAGEHTQIKHIITRNFVARCAVSLRGVMVLWRVNSFADCWMLYRGILDRLFHLHYLNRTDSFKSFDDWSFVQQYEDRRTIRSSEDFKDRIDHDFFRETEEQAARARALNASPPSWCRPRARDEAKQMGLLFLYQLGYDFASTQVHPMANDGQQDYTTLTGHGGPWPNQIAAVNNACLAALLLLQEAMRGDPCRKWHRLVLQCMDEALTGLRSGARDYLLTFVELGRAAPDGNWCNTSK